ncbi:MAG: beta-ketoacyl synthase chain length factor [Nitrospirae bacterium]|nr:beta-ketoacyl synthase chain length factor [Nitrospirota bacterium]
MSTRVLGIGTVSALGCGIETVKSGLEGKVSPAIEEHTIETADGEASLKVYTAAVRGLDRFVSRPAMRRMDRFIQMALLSSYLAIEDSGIILDDRTRVGIIFGSGYGPLQTTFSFLDSLIDFGDKCASPTLFANSVHNSLASHVSILLKLQGPCLTVTCFEQTTFSVMSTAINWLRDGTADYVLAGVGDEYCDVRGYATLMSGSRGSSAIRPLSFDECTYMPGEGFAAFLLGKESGDRAYCSLSRCETGRRELSCDHETLFLAANGDRDTGRFYKPLADNRRVQAYSPLYGGMPAGNGFDIAIAALSLKEGVVYPSPDKSDENNTDNTDNNANTSEISCIGFDRNGTCSLFTLAK